MSDDPIQRLRAENDMLRSELDAMQERLDKAQALRKKSVQKMGSILLPAFDRLRLVRNFVALSDILAAFAEKGRAKPTRDDIVEAAQAFALSALRFTIRRRMLFFLFSIAAFAVPVLQTWMLIQQNQMIKHQNEMFNVEVDDIVARGVTSESLLANELNGILLGARDFESLNHSLFRIFGADPGGYFKNSKEEVTQSLRRTAGLGYYVQALNEGLRRPAGGYSLRELFESYASTKTGAMIPTFARCGELLREVLRAGADDLDDDAQLQTELNRFVHYLGQLLTSSYALARAAGEEQLYFQAVATLFERAAQVPRGGSDRPFHSTFEIVFGSLMIQYALGPTFGKTPPVMKVDASILLKDGFEKLKTQTTGSGQINYRRLAEMLSVPQ